MQLTGTILFLGALVGFLLCLYRILVRVSSTKTYIAIQSREKLIFNIMLSIVLFIIMTISTGVL